MTCPNHAKPFGVVREDAGQAPWGSIYQRVPYYVQQSQADDDVLPKCRCEKVSVNLFSMPLPVRKADMALRAWKLPI